MWKDPINSQFSRLISYSESDLRCWFLVLIDAESKYARYPMGQRCMMEDCGRGQRPLFSPKFEGNFSGRPHFGLGELGRLIYIRIFMGNMHGSLGRLLTNSSPAALQSGRVVGMLGLRMQGERVSTLRARSTVHSVPTVEENAGVRAAPQCFFRCCLYFVQPVGSGLDLHGERKTYMA